MVVDDESALRQLLVRALSLQGIRCDFAENGEAALALVKRHRYDLVVTDLRMPGMNGHSLCVQILGSSQRVPIICVLTGIMQEKIEQDLRRRGIEYIFYKPIDYQQFSLDLLRILEKYEEDHAIEMPAKEVSGATRHCVVILSSDFAYAEQFSVGAEEKEIDVVIAVSTDHLLEMVNHRRIDLLVIDQNLSGFLKGDQIVSRLHQDLINIPSFLRIAAEEKEKEKLEASEGVERLVSVEYSAEDVAQQVSQYLKRLSYRRLVIETSARRLVTDFADVPPIPHVLTRLTTYLELSTDELSISELVSEIETDSRLTSELIKVANSSLVGASSKQNDLKGVVTLLGPRQAIAICLSLGLRTVRSELMKPWAAEFRDWYLKRTSLIASTAQAFAKHFEGVPPETAFLLGILQDVGMLVLAEHYGETYFDRVIQRVRTIPTLQYINSERLVTNTDHGQVSAAVLQSWGFPFSIVQPVFAHHVEAEDKNLTKMSKGLVRCLRIGEVFAEMCDQPAPQRIMKTNELLKQYYSTNRQDTRHVFLEAIEKANQNNEILHTPPMEVDELQAIVRELEQQGQVVT